MIKVNFSLSYIFIALFFAAISFSLVAEEILIDEVVASVNDEVVMRSELEERALEVIGRLQASNTKAPPEEEILSQVLDRLVIERIQLLKASHCQIKRKRGKKRW